jgi:hypothetical protein
MGEYVYYLFNIFVSFPVLLLSHKYDIRLLGRAKDLLRGTLELLDCVYYAISLTRLAA